MVFLLCDGNYYENIVGNENIDDYILSEKNNLLDLQKDYEHFKKIFNNKDFEVCIVEKWNPHELKNISGWNNPTIVYNEFCITDYYGG